MFIIKCALDALECGLGIVTCILSIEYRKGKKKSDFTVQKSSRHHFKQIIKVNTISSNSCWYHVPLDMMWWEVGSSCILSLIMRKTSHSLNWRIFYRITTTPQNCYGHEKQRRTDWRRLGDQMTMHCGILDRILEQKKDIHGKTGRTWMKSEVESKVMYQCYS